MVVVNEESFFFLESNYLLEVYERKQSEWVSMFIKLTIVATVCERTESNYLHDHFNYKNIQRHVVDLLGDILKLGTLIARLQQHHKSIRKNYATDKQFKIVVVNDPVESISKLALGSRRLKLERRHKTTGLNPTFLPRSQ